MRIRHLLPLLLLALCNLFVLEAHAGPPAPGIESVWSGRLEVPGHEMRIVFHISRRPDGTLTATMDSPDQGVAAIPVDGVVYSGNQLKLTLKAIEGGFEGRMTVDGRTIEGNWIHRSLSLPLSLARVEQVPERKRPQEPKKPYPYLEEEVEYANPANGILLSGTLTLPGESSSPVSGVSSGPASRSSRRYPAVILISGAGPNTRDAEAFGHRVFLVLADYLTRQGVAVLRADKRGVGRSTGDYALATTVQFADDTLAAFEYLKQRPEIDARSIGLIGQSEGGVIAPMVAARSSDVAFIVLIAGSGLSGARVLATQQTAMGRALGVGEEAIARQRALTDQMFVILEHEPDLVVAKQRMRAEMLKAMGAMTGDERKLGGGDAGVEAALKGLLTPWFRFFLSYDPAVALKQVHCPVLALNGERDLQVAADENLAAIGEALKTAGNPDVTLQKLIGLNHLLQTSQTGSPNEYSQIEETMSPSALKLIGDWIQARAPSGPRP